jgi:hypothetical protein
MLANQHYLKSPCLFFFYSLQIHKVDDIDQLPTTALDPGFIASAFRRVLRLILKVSRKHKVTSPHSLNFAFSGGGSVVATRYRNNANVDCTEEPPTLYALKVLGDRDHRITCLANISSYTCHFCIQPHESGDVWKILSVKRIRLLLLILFKKIRFVVAGMSPSDPHFSSTRTTILK